ncbi:MAG: hypothetical protein ACLTXI_01350 [Collinsella sp.]
MADTLLAMGTADFVAMGRGSLADPHMPNKARLARPAPSGSASAVCRATSSRSTSTPR